MSNWIWSFVTILILLGLGACAIIRRLTKNTTIKRYAYVVGYILLVSWALFIVIMAIYWIPQVA